LTSHNNLKINKNKSTKKDNKINGVKAEERDDRSTENSSKLEDSPHGMTTHVRSKPTDSISSFLGGMNMVPEVKEYLKNSNFMAQMNWMETKKIGTLTLAERRIKIEKYLQKRKKRTWSRKINYDCRKRVADGRLRIKGRFVTREQAFILLNDANIPYDAEKITNAEIKELLTDKFGSMLKKKKAEAQANPTESAKRPSDMDLEDLMNGLGEDAASELSE